MEITKEVLIDRLIENNHDDYSIGYNAALIGLLKASWKVGAFIQSANTTLPKLIINETHYPAIEKIVALGVTNKLMAVKEIKDVFDLGLKDAKDIMDAYSGAIM